jgi:ubiquinone/menaquinone biosynthesis C-methylase UbiE
MKSQSIIEGFVPPIAWRGLKTAKRRLARWRTVRSGADASAQDLGPYWEETMAQTLESWGEGNVWNEAQMFFLEAQGKVLDIACGTGKTIELLSRLNPSLEIYGCDISDFLIQKAVERTGTRDRLAVCDATNMTQYQDGSFDYAYTIGSLEHFTEDGIAKMLRETHRVVRRRSFHMVPVARSGVNEGWVKTTQSYHNNSVHWWLALFHREFSSVRVFESVWEDEISRGKWFVAGGSL